LALDLIGAGATAIAEDDDGERQTFTIYRSTSMTSSPLVGITKGQKDGPSDLTLSARSTIPPRLFLAWVARHCRSDSQAQAGFLKGPGTQQPGNALPWGPSRFNLPNTFLVLVISSHFSLASFSHFAIAIAVGVTYYYLRSYMRCACCGGIWWGGGCCQEMSRRGGNPTLETVVLLILIRLRLRLSSSIQVCSSSFSCCPSISTSPPL
jgi:hypothetical protein